MLQQTKWCNRPKCICPPYLVTRPVIGLVPSFLLQTFGRFFGHQQHYNREILNKYAAQFREFYSSCLYLLRVSRSLQNNVWPKPVHCTVFSVNLPNYTVNQTIHQTNWYSNCRPNTLDQTVSQTKWSPRPNSTLDQMVQQTIWFQTKWYSRPKGTVDQTVQQTNWSQTRWYQTKWYQTKQYQIKRYCTLSGSEPPS